MEEILFLTAPLKERIWGGDYFKKINKTTSNEAIGELWSTSAHKQGESVITNGKYKGRTLSDLFENENQLFNLKDKEFPILIKVIDAKEALSVQVHPNDEYSMKNEGQLGKTEGWLILDCKEDASIVLGINANNKEELVKSIENNDYNNLLTKIKVSKGQFFPIYAGTVHAIGAGIQILEVQQSSDVTYRFYDYDRKDDKGNTRELHVKQAVEVTTYDKPQYSLDNWLEKGTNQLWNNDYFSVDLIDVKNSLVISKPKYYSIITIAEGNFTLDGVKLSLGDSFIVTAEYQNKTLEGNGKLVLTNPNKK